MRGPPELDARYGRRRLSPSSSFKRRAPSAHASELMAVGGAGHLWATNSAVLRGRRWYLLTRTPQQPLGTSPYQFLLSI